MTQAPPKRDITTAEACAELGINRSTISRWVALGHISPTMKLPGRTGAFLFSRSEIARVKQERAA